ncbi:MAG: riboflavin synthase [Deltaproteobacteria bacterium]|nr:riboflavin synthase [Deltaproteobacteria bacterium]
MFTGIIEERAVVTKMEIAASGASLQVRSSLGHAETGLGDSIAINGVCLTVVAIDSGLLKFDVSNETLRCSNLGQLSEGSEVNLERSLKAGERISGHFVFGHVDCVVQLRERRAEGDAAVLWWSLPAEFQPYIAEKGSVALNGVSLTVVNVEKERFSVCIIPHTASLTNLQSLQPGDTVNLEVDMLARYAVNALFPMKSSKRESNISRDFLKEHGFIE